MDEQLIYGSHHNHWLYIFEGLLFEGYYEQLHRSKNTKFQHLETNIDMVSSRIQILKFADILESLHTALYPQPKVIDN